MLKRRTPIYYVAVVLFMTACVIAAVWLML
jgi:hypothetical protein